MHKLTSIEAVGLTSGMAIEIPLPADQEFVILHGPNGVGKTRLLESLQRFFSGSAHPTISPISMLKTHFADGSWIAYTRNQEQASWSSSTGASFEVPSASRDSQFGKAAIRSLRDQGIIRALIPPSDDKYRDLETREVLSGADAIDRYMDQLDEEIVPIPEEIRSAVRSVNSMLIEVNRLRNVLVPGYENEPRPVERMEEMIVHCATDLHQRMVEAKAQSSTFAQELDSAYPKRLLESDPRETDAAEVDRLSQDAIQARSQLVEAGLSAAQLGPLALHSMEPDKDWQLAALKLHYQNEREKCDRLMGLANRIILFRDLLSEKLIGKEIGIDSEVGFVARSSAGEIPLTHLSSGEKHEVVMLYRLLFSAPDAGLVLIDEPEISLHVKWQRQFLNDLLQINSLNSLRFVIATHSPQIVGAWLDRVVSLGDVE